MNTNYGIWGQLRRAYLYEHKRGTFKAMEFNGTLEAHLSEVDRVAEEMFSQLVKQLAEKEGVTEELKACDQMKWVGKMNNIRERVEEVICNELIYS